jgi:hypothetical protein
MNYNYLILLCLIIFLAWCTLNIYTWFKNSRTYRDDKSHFMSDMYKMQVKWSKRGKYDYARAIGLIIEGFNLPDEEKQPETEEGRLTKKLMTSE